MAVGRATQSLTHVDQQVASRSADNLTPLDVADAPSEIGALVRSLNGLFDRVHGLIEQERRFTADAAHELRTPLAGIRAQAQVALGATGDAEKARALDGVIAGCDRATHTVDYRTPGTQAPGTGLGLSIVQRIVDWHRGTIRLDSPASTIGLHVTIALPRVMGERA